MEAEMWNVNPDPSSSANPSSQTLNNARGPAFVVGALALLVTIGGWRALDSSRFANSGSLVSRGIESIVSSDGKPDPGAFGSGCVPTSVSQER
jgi:hypothetical protein